ncbi:MAG: hypothetical protein E7052_07305 [Lentisphaerae bacterium]|nr:hypothetical protein [Lentisphaerota bacterium]
MKNCELLIDITSAALGKPGAAEWMSSAQTLAAQYNAVIGVQVHNSALVNEFELAVACNYPLSFHAPVLGEYMMNFAAEDASLSWQMAAEQADLMRRYQVKRAVFHGALMTDLAIYAFGHGMSYHECMMQAQRSDLLRSSGSFFVRDYTASDEYLLRRDRLKNNLLELRKRYPDLLWCVENDFPAHTAGVLRGCDLAYLEHPVCFDTGHMWAASKMLELDFYAELDAALAGGMVEMIHLHASKHKFSAPHDSWGDGHLPLNIATDMDIAKIIRKCRQNQVKHIVLEIADASLSDVQTVLRYYFED